MGFALGKVAFWYIGGVAGDVVDCENELTRIERGVQEARAMAGQAAI